MKKLNKQTIGLLGYGCVGQGFYEALKSGISPVAEVNEIAVKQQGKPRKADTKLIRFDANEVVNNDENQLIVEVIDDADEAKRLVLNSFRQGKSVVSANKKLIANNLKQLLEAKNQFGVSFLYEASVGGAIPIIRTLEEHYADENIVSVRGIINGSSNFILSKIFNEGKPYEDALKEAQELGFAESDPTLDVGGFDAKYKLVILALHAFGVILNPDEVLNIGINRISNEDVAFAKANNLKIKLVASLSKVGDYLNAAVYPEFVNQNDELFPVENEFNAIAVKGAFSGTQLFKGQGAGSFPTGSAVKADVVSLIKGYDYTYSKLSHGLSLELNNSLKKSFYISGKNLEALPLEINRWISKNSAIVSLSVEDVIKSKELFEKSGVSLIAVGESQLFDSLKPDEKLVAVA
jgi:homoserine dehydrogenase